MSDDYTEVEVHWLDANASTDEITKDEATLKKPAYTITKGFLVNETDDVVVVSMDRYPDHDDHYGTHITIPWVMIVEYYECEG